MFNKMNSYLNFIALMNFICSLTPATSTTFRQSFYNKLENVQFPDITSDDLCDTSKCDGSVLSCVLACETDPTCSSLTYDPAQRTCMRNVGDIFTFGKSPVTSSSSVHYVGKIQADVTDGNWTLVFRGQGNNTVSILTTYTNSSYRSDSDMSHLHAAATSKLPDVRAPHYRSRWYDTWPSADIDQVKLELYESGSTVVSMIFSGTGSTNQDWFSFSRLVSVTPYTDLTLEPARFSMTGMFTRHFYVSSTSSYFDCAQYAWVIVEDEYSNTCYWTPQVNWPRILYSKATTKVNFDDRTSNDVGVADALAVFIKFK